MKRSLIIVAIALTMAGAQTSFAQTVSTVVSPTPTSSPAASVAPDKEAEEIARQVESSPTVVVTSPPAATPTPPQSEPNAKAKPAIAVSPTEQRESQPATGPADPNSKEALQAEIKLLRSKVPTRDLPSPILPGYRKESHGKTDSKYTGEFRTENRWVQLSDNHSYDSRTEVRDLEHELQLYVTVFVGDNGGISSNPSVPIELKDGRIPHNDLKVWDRDNGGYTNVWVADIPRNTWPSPPTSKHHPSAKPSKAKQRQDQRYERRT